MFLSICADLVYVLLSLLPYNIVSARSQAKVYCLCLLSYYFNYNFSSIGNSPITLCYVCVNSLSHHRGRMTDTN